MKPKSILFSNKISLFILFSVGIIFITSISIPEMYSQVTGQNLSETDSNSIEQNTQSYEQEKAIPKMFVKITSHKNTDEVETGVLTIKGISSDNATKDCIVQVDLNNQRPYRTVTPTGLGGTGDFSTWTFTYTKDYKEIGLGFNDITSKLTCTNPGPLTKWYTVVVNGIPPPIPIPIPLP